ncbi:MAG: hypothetical protein ABI203_08470 [Mucilaginibacter sp.]
MTHPLAPSLLRKEGVLKKANYFPSFRFSGESVVDPPTGGDDRVSKKKLKIIPNIL